MSQQIVDKVTFLSKCCDILWHLITFSLRSVTTFLCSDFFQQVIWGIYRRRSSERKAKHGIPERFHSTLHTRLFWRWDSVICFAEIQSYEKRNACSEISGCKRFRGSVVGSSAYSLSAPSYPTKIVSFVQYPPDTEIENFATKFLKIIQVDLGDSKKLPHPPSHWH